MVFFMGRAKSKFQCPRLRRAKFAMKRLLAAFLISIQIVGPARAQVVSDMGVQLGIKAQLVSASSQIAKMSDMVKVASNQLQTLQKVADGIRKLESVISGGVQGLLGEAADKLGLKDVFEVGKQLQTTFRDGVQLYQDVRALPDQAKAQLANIGIAVKDLEKYLSEGVVYDVFSGMAVDEWRDVFKNPIDALSNGAVGRAVVTSEAYLDTEDMRREYAERLAHMSPEERARLSGSVGVDMGLLNYGAWAKGMEKRLKRSVDFTLLGEKLTEAAGGKGKAPTVVEATASLNGSVIANFKATNEYGRQQAEANQVGAEQLTNQTMLMNSREKREARKESAEAMGAVPE